MSQSEQKIVQYLNQAHAMEIGLVGVLQSQIAMTPRGKATQVRTDLIQEPPICDRLTGLSARHEDRPVQIASCWRRISSG